MMMNYEKLLFDELRYVSFEKANAEITDQLMAKAVTLNENLLTLGYTLNPKDIALIAVSPSADELYEKVCSMMDQVSARPMYPHFPYQVMEMDEAVFRFHQMAHYFSTYGLENLFGVQVKRGWLPCEDLPDTEDERADQRLVLGSKCIELLPMEDLYMVPLKRILSRKERMTMPEKEIVTEAMKHVSQEEASSLQIGFKENLNDLYGIIFFMEDKEVAFSLLRGLCQHTGDVLRCIDVMLREKKFHFKTSQKRFFVKLLENYPVKDFRSNLVLSGKNAEHNLFLLQYLDYSIYSRSEKHMEAVNELRDGNLRSWNSIVNRMLSSGDEGALDFIAKRPGMMLRMIAHLMKLGYAQEDIVKSLEGRAAELSMQTLVSTMNYFGKLTSKERADSEKVYDVFEELLSLRMKGFKSPLYGKKVKFQLDEYDLNISEIQTNNKSSEGGYIRSGIAYRIPEDVSALRFFVYWNDEERVDVDLHVSLTDLNGEKHYVGWNESFKNLGAVFSGDITTSDAAEYIDVNLSAPIDRVYANINLYAGKRSLGDIDTCFVGMMAVPEDADEDTSLYCEANCFFKHNLRQHCRTINYGFIDVQKRCLVFDGTASERYGSWYDEKNHHYGKLSLARFLELLLSSQQAEKCEDENDADVILVMGKASNEKEISLIDSNFFMEK